MIQYQILQTNITKTVWQRVRIIIDEILGVRGLKGGNLEKQGSPLIRTEIKGGSYYFNSCFHFDLPPPLKCLGYIDEEDIFCILMHES